MQPPRLSKTRGHKEVPQLQRMCQLLSQEVLQPGVPGEELGDPQRLLQKSKGVKRRSLQTTVKERKENVKVSFKLLKAHSVYVLSLLYLNLF